MKQKLRTAFALPVLFFVLACDVSLPPSSVSTPSIDTDSNSQVEPAPPDVNQMAQFALNAAMAAASAAAVTIPTKDIQPIFEAGLPPPACPLIDAALAGRDLDLSFEYGEGCESTYFQETSMRGTVRGIYYTAFNAFDFLFDNVSVNEQLLLGAVTGRIDVVDEARQTTLNVNVTLQNFTTRGTFLVHFGSESIRLDGTDIVVTDSAGVSFQVTLIGVGVLLGSNPSVSPSEGSALIMEGSSTSNVRMIIRFTSETPISGRVLLEPNSND